MSELDVMPVMSSKYLSAIPMKMLLPYEAQAIRNHGQTLHRLASRGGMCPPEILDVMDGRKWGSSKACDENDVLLSKRVERYITSLESAQPTKPEI